MSDYDFNTWLQQQAGRDPSDIIDKEFKTVADAELRAKGLRPPIEGVTTEQFNHFATRIKNFLTLLKWHQRSPGIPEPDWQVFKPYCEDYVKKGQLDEKVLKLF